MTALKHIGDLLIDSRVNDHRFVTECLAAVRVIDKREKCAGVVGTSNSKSVELYGWVGDIAPHCDGKGFIYFMPIISSGGHVHCLGCEPEPLNVGRVIRLNDRETHWTNGDGHTVCLFIGVYDEPDDQIALEAFKAGLDKLTAGDYYGSPRASKGFRVIMHDECLVDNIASYSYKLLVDAKRDNDLILTCSFGCCQKPAAIIDNHYPYFHEMNRCVDHIGDDCLDRI